MNIQDGQVMVWNDSENQFLPAFVITYGDYFTLEAEDSSGQTFTQLNQGVPGDLFPAYAGLVYEAANVADANQFGAVFKIVTIDDLCSNRPAGHRGPPCYKVALYAEGRSTEGEASDFSIYGANFVAESNTGHVGMAKSLELNINEGNGDDTAVFCTPITATGQSMGLEITSGGVNRPAAALMILATRPANQFRRGIVIPTGPTPGIQIRGFEMANEAAPPSDSLQGFVMVQGLATQAGFAAYAAARDTDVGVTPASRAFALYTAAGASIAEISMTGIFRGTGLGTGFEFYKDATPSKAWNVGMGVPGSLTIGDHLLFVHYDGSAWQTKLKVQNNGWLVINEAINIITGNGSPEGVHVSTQGSLYLRLDGSSGTTLYVKETGGNSNTGWVAK